MGFAETDEWIEFESIKPYSPDYHMELVEVSNWVKPKPRESISQAPHSHIYQTKEMAKVMETLGFTPRFFALLDGGVRVAQLLLLEKRGLFFSSWLSYSPPVLLGNVSSRSVSVEFLKRLQERAGVEGVDWITIWGHPLFDRSGWFVSVGFDEVEKQSVVLELGKSREETWKLLYKHARRDVRKGKQTEAFPVEAVSLDEMREFYKIYEAHHERIGLVPFPWAYFEAFWNEVIGRGMGKLFLTKLKGETIAGLMVGAFNGQVFEFTNAIKPDAYECYPTDLMNWKLIEWAVDNGFDYFDLSTIVVGEANEKEAAINRFKKKWGKVCFYHEYKWYNGRTKKLLVKGLKKVKEVKAGGLK